MHYFYENRVGTGKGGMPFSIYRSNNLSYRAHWHTELELVYVESGNIWVGINNHRLNLVNGDLAIITSGDIHYYETKDKSSIVLLIFKPEFFGITASRLGNQRLSSSFLSEKIVNHKIKPILYDLLEEVGDRQILHEQYIKAKLIELSVSILRYLPNQLTINKHKRDFSKLDNFREILMYIENNFTRELSLQNLAAKFNIDPYNLSKLFNSITGNNLKTYINILRVTKAKNMIIHTNEKMIDIAFECGFNSIRTFNRAFKKHYGSTPSSYRNDYPTDISAG